MYNANASVGWALTHVGIWRRWVKSMDNLLNLPAYVRDIQGGIHIIRREEETWIHKRRIWVYTKASCPPKKLSYTRWTSLKKMSHPKSKVPWFLKEPWLMWTQFPMRVQCNLIVMSFKLGMWLCLDIKYQFIGANQSQLTWGDIIAILTPEMSSRTPNWFNGVQCLF